MSFVFPSSLSPFPSWMTYIDGSAPIVLIAPHGGRRPADAPIRDSIKVNDLHTAELTALLAARTRSYAFINQACDRNELDLNRISQVCARAPWFLTALVELLSTLTQRHGTVRVFSIHGWNVVQPVCDLGMGLRVRGNRLALVGRAAPTISTDFFTTNIVPFRAAALAQEIDVALGRRYPAANKDNVLQLFSSRFADHQTQSVRALAGLCTAGKIEAVQLELGVSLRWPGTERERFINVFCDTLGTESIPVAKNGQDFSTLTLPPALLLLPSSHNDATLTLTQAPQSTRLGLHFHDAGSGVGVTGGIEFDRASPTCAGRLLVSLGGSEMALFTGEDEFPNHTGQVQVGGFVWHKQADGLRITYRGTVMRFRHPHAFIRLEEGLAASWIEPAEICLQLTLPPTLATPLPLLLSHLTGTISLLDGPRLLDSWGFVDGLPAEEAGRLLPRRLVSLPFGPEFGLFLSRVETPDGPQSAGVLYTPGDIHQLRSRDWELQFTFAQGRPTSYHLSLASSAPLTLHCHGETVTTIPIIRHTPKGSALAVTFGLSRTVWNNCTAYGVYEVSQQRED